MDWHPVRRGDDDKGEGFQATEDEVGSFEFVHRPNEEEESGEEPTGHVDGIDDSCIAHGLPKKESERWNSLPKVYLAPE